MHRKNWEAQDIIRREDLVMILSGNLKVTPHPIPENMAGSLYTVDGIAVCCDFIMDLVERRFKEMQKNDSADNHQE